MSWRVGTCQIRIFYAVDASGNVAGDDLVAGYHYVGKALDATIRHHISIAVDGA